MAIGNETQAVVLVTGARTEEILIDLARILEPAEVAMKDDPVIRSVALS
jgi:hypothetical protein